MSVWNLPVLGSVEECFKKCFVYCKYLPIVVFHFLVLVVIRSSTLTLNSDLNTITVW